jgi:hypothetical protein
VFFPPRPPPAQAGGRRADFDVTYKTDAYPAQLEACASHLGKDLAWSDYRNGLRFAEQCRKTAKCAEQKTKYSIVIDDGSLSD